MLTDLEGWRGALAPDFPYHAGRRDLLGPTTPTGSHASGFPASAIRRRLISSSETFLLTLYVPSGNDAEDTLALFVNDQLQPSSAIGVPNELIPAAVPFIPIDLKAVPKHLDGLIDGDSMTSQLVFIELIVELLRIELLPINQRSILKRIPAAGFIPPLPNTR